jgi:hypothetical protein
MQGGAGKREGVGRVGLRARSSTHFPFKENTAREGGEGMGYQTLGMDTACRVQQQWQVIISTLIKLVGVAKLIMTICIDFFPPPLIEERNPPALALAPTLLRL